MKEPKRLQRRPHFHGMPIPATVVIGADGVPDFATLHVERAQNLARAECCALCGQKMRGPYAFVGGANTIALGVYVDGPMHEDCAAYSFTICPHVSGTHREYRTEAKQHEGMKTITSMAAVAKRMGMVLAHAYSEIAGRWTVEKEAIIKVVWEEDLRG